MLTNLYELFLRHTSLTTIRSDFFSSTLSGTIPSSIGELTNLVYLYVLRSAAPGLNRMKKKTRSFGGNSLSETIPSSIVQLTSLTYLYAACRFDVDAHLIRLQIVRDQQFVWRDSVQCGIVEVSSKCFSR